MTIAPIQDYLRENISVTMLHPLLENLNILTPKYNFKVILSNDDK